MAKTQVEVITSIERQRRWSSAEKERLVAGSLERGAVVSALARETGLHPTQLYKWRRQLCARQDWATTGLMHDGKRSNRRSPPWSQSHWRSSGDWRRERPACVDLSSPRSRLLPS
jgi:transposase